MLESKFNDANLGDLGVKKPEWIEQFRAMYQVWCLFRSPATLMESNLLIDSQASPTIMKVTVS